MERLEICIFNKRPGGSMYQTGLGDTERGLVPSPPADWGRAPGRHLPRHQFSYLERGNDHRSLLLSESCVILDAFQ